MSRLAPMWFSSDDEDDADEQIAQLESRKRKSKENIEEQPKEEEVEYSDDSCFSDLDENRRHSCSDSSDPCENDDLGLINFSGLTDKTISRFLFRNENLEPLSFVLMLHDYSLELKATKVIEERGGIVYSTVTEMDNYSIVLVKDSSLFRAHLGPVFKVSFLKKCLEKNRIVNITPYVKTFNNAPAIEYFDFMDVVYFKKLSWSNVPERIMLNKKSSPTKSEPEPKKHVFPKKCTSFDASEDVTVIDSSSESDIKVEDGECEAEKRPAPKIFKKVNKHSRMAYSDKEDSNIVRYIAEKDGYNSIRGTLLWKKMEKKEVCPTRTWQSMKEHFLKKILYKIDYYNFLSEKQKKEFRKILLKR